MNNRNGLILAVVLFIVLVAGFIGVFTLPGRHTEPAQNQQHDVTPAQNPDASSQTTSEGSVEANSSGSNHAGSVAEIDNIIEVTAPLIGSTVASPLTITGQARGAWYFEASAPYELRNAQGNVIAQGHVTAQGEWMTDDFVPFKAIVTFPAQPKGSMGTLVLHNDNPSGDPSREKTLQIPLKF